MIDDFFEITPRIVRTNQPNRITVKGRYFQRDLATLGELEAVLLPNSGYIPEAEIKESTRYYTIPSHFDAADAARLVIELPPVSEGELSIVINQLSENGAKHTELLRFALYALDEDLYVKRPYRGDLHVHSSFSQCGKRTDDPRYVAAVARAHGLDFMALTDHVQMEPALLAREFLEKCPTDFLLIPGEECHVLAEKQPTLFCRNRFLPENHIVSIGASQGVVRYANEHFEAYWREVNEKADSLDRAYPENVRIAMAGADWLIDKIHEFGGMAIFCHPFWRPYLSHNLPDPVREYILRQNKFDCMEVIGLGRENWPNFYESNALAVSFWHEASIRAGRSIPLVGNTDSHDADELLGTQYSIVFSDKCTPEALTEAICNGASVAVRDYASDCTPQVLGTLRFTAYAYFLLREFYPRHDELCAIEGKTLRAHLRGECEAKEIPPGEHWTETLFASFYGAEHR